MSDYRDQPFVCENPHRGPLVTSIINERLLHMRGNGGAYLRDVVL
jgi:hypothetical protein